MPSIDEVIDLRLTLIFSLASVGLPHILSDLYMAIAYKTADLYTKISQHLLQRLPKSSHFHCVAITRSLVQDEKHSDNHGSA